MHKYSIGRWITSLAFNSNGDTLAAGTSANIGFVQPNEASTEENPIVLIRIDGVNQPLATFMGHRYGVLHLAFSADGAMLASSGSDGVVMLWRLGEKSSIRFRKIVTSAAEKAVDVINHVSFDPNANSVVVAYDNEILLLKRDDLSTLLLSKTIRARFFVCT